MSNDNEQKRLQELREFFEAGQDGTEAPAVETKKNESIDPWEGYGDPDETMNEKDKNKGDTEYVQLARLGHGFVLSGKTQPILDPGVYRIELYNNQVPIFVKQDITTDSLVRLPDSRSDEIINEIERFWTLKETFKKFGYTHKRGFLLWGPPGSGKTSTISIVMAQMVKDGGLVFLAEGVHPRFLANQLLGYRQVDPDRRIVVIMEDLDTIIEQFGESTTLSILDGENTIGNAVFIATTNYPENLDGRIKNRPSRFDRVEKIGMPSPEARRVYLESRKLGLSKDDLEFWVEQTEGFSIAHIKEIIVSCLCFGNPFEEVLARMETMMNNKNLTSTTGERPAGFRAESNEMAAGSIQNKRK